MSILVPQGETVHAHGEGTGHDIYNYVIEGYAKYKGMYPGFTVTETRKVLPDSIGVE